jgi:hypothetical protein
MCRILFTLYFHLIKYYISLYIIFILTIMLNKWNIIFNSFFCIIVKLLHYFSFANVQISNINTQFSFLFMSQFTYLAIDMKNLVKQTIHYYLKTVNCIYYYLI